MKIVPGVVGLLVLAGTLAAGMGVVRADSPSAGDAIAAATSATGASYTVTLWNGSPFIDLTIDGVPGRFLFDTGANISGFDQTWLRSSNVPWTSGVDVTLSGTTGVLTTPTAVVDRLDLGHGYFSSPSFLIEDFSGFGWPGGRQEAGLLGMDFIGAFEVTLDLANGTAVLALASERPVPGADETSLPLDLTTTHVPTVTAKIAGIEVPCRLDTGNAYLDSRPFLDVNRATVNTLQNAGILLVQTGTVNVAGVSGTETLPLLEGDPSVGPIAITVGPVEVSNLVLVVHDQGTLVQDTPLALAGTPVLSRLGTFRIDPFDAKLWVGGR